MQISLEDAFKEAVALHQASKLDAAENLYRQILQHDPSHLETSHNLGLILANRGNFESALPLLKLACESAPAHENFIVSYVETLIAAGQPRQAKTAVKKAVAAGVGKKAIRNLTRKIKRAPKNSAPKNTPSVTEAEALLQAYSAKKNDEAITLANRLTTRFPDHPLAWKVLGAVLGQEERYEESVYAGQRALSLSPEDPEAHNGLGVTYLEVNQPTRAELSFRKALALRPKYADAHTNLANALKELGRFEEAHIHYSAAIELQPTNANWRINQGWAYFAADDFAQAELSFLEAIKLHDNHPVAHSAGYHSIRCWSQRFWPGTLRGHRCGARQLDFLLILLELQRRLD